MRIRINELESLVEMHIKNEENERQLRLRMESERDEWMQQGLEHARKEITNQLTMSHKKELEMMHVRFKLVTNMERSSSEQSLEKNKVIFLKNIDQIIIKIDVFFGLNRMLIFFNLYFSQILDIM